MLSVIPPANCKICYIYSTKTYRMKHIIYLLVCLVASVTVQAQAKKNTELVSPKVFAERMAKQPGQVVDVRTPKEFKAGYIEGAANLHLYDKDFEQRVDKLDKNKPVYVYCKVGGRSAEAVTIMQQKGFKKIVELKGGMDAWTAVGLPVKK